MTTIYELVWSWEMGVGRRETGDGSEAQEAYLNEKVLCFSAKDFFLN
jgi:hypothetical protein